MLATKPDTKSHCRRQDLIDLDTVTGDFIQLALDLRLHHMDVSTIRRRAASEGMAFLTFRLKELHKALLDGVRNGLFQCPSTFRTDKRSALPCFLGNLFSAIFDSEGQILDQPCPNAFRDIVQITTLYSKCEMPYSKELQAQVVDGFLRTECELHACRDVLPNELDEHDRKVVSLASQLLGIVFKGFDPEDLRCKDGPGVVSNHEVGTSDWVVIPIFVGRHLLATFVCSLRIPKYDKTLSPSTSVYRFFSSFWYNENEFESSTHKYPTMGHHWLFQDQEYAKVILVPKDIRGPRLISCEPRENQWAQQGIMEFMVGRLQTSPLTRGLVNFRFQSINQELAIAASSGEISYATLDLKDASDRVTWNLVRLLFADSPALLEALRHVRSAYSLVDVFTTLTQWGRVFNTVFLNGSWFYKVPLQKHAPMGSSVCFPVMASCIWSLLTAHLCVRYGVQMASKSVFVYGDDILVPNEWAPECIALLERFLLKVNGDKSFMSGKFRESCGTDAFDGAIVTPVKVRSFYSCDQNLTQTQKAKVLTSLLATANLAYQAGFPLLAERLYKRVESGLGSPLLLGSPSSPYLCRWIGARDSYYHSNLTLAEMSPKVETRCSVRTRIKGVSPRWCTIKSRGPVKFRAWTIASVEDPVYETAYSCMHKRSQSSLTPLSPHIKGLMEFNPLKPGWGSTRNNFVLRRVWIGEEEMRHVERPAHL